MAPQSRHVYAGSDSSASTTYGVDKKRSPPQIVHRMPDRGASPDVAVLRFMLPPRGLGRVPKLGYAAVSRRSPWRIEATESRGLTRVRAPNSRRAFGSGLDAVCLSTLRRFSAESTRWFGACAGPR